MQEGKETGVFVMYVTGTRMPELWNRRRQNRRTMVLWLKTLKQFF